MEKVINISTRRLKAQDLEAIYHLADTGIHACDLLLDTASEPEQFEKTDIVKNGYKIIKQKVESLGGING